MLRKSTQSLVLLAALGLTGCAVQAEGFSLTASSGSKKFSAGLEVNDDVAAEETGLPVYPGSRRDLEDKRNSDSVNLGFWGGDFGVKLVVVKMESNDSAESVAEFYRRELARMGTVLDCSKGAAESRRQKRGERTEEKREEKRGDEKRSSSRPLTCDNDRAEKNGQLYKTGTRRNQYMVSILPRGSGTAFQLIHVAVRGLD
jgi:hypothetical protein